jgi:hypothetical protein
MISIFFDFEIKKNARYYTEDCIANVVYASINIIEVLFTFLKTNRMENFIKFIEFNTLIHKITKLHFTKMYCNAIQKLNKIKRLCIYYIRKRRISFSSTDLLLNPLSSLPSTELIDIMDNYKKYTFKVFDLSNIIYKALIHSDDFLFSIPLHIKNPYTNIEFSIENLYIIYLCMQTRGLYIHPLFTLFMNEHFNLIQFSIKHEGLLKEYIIDNQVKNYSKTKTSNEIKTMLTELTVYNPKTLEYTIFFSNISIIPSSVLQTFKPLLYHYMRYLYSTNSYYRQTEYNILIKKLIAFKQQNPSFNTKYNIDVPITKVNYKNIVIPRRISSSRINTFLPSFLFVS